MATTSVQGSLAAPTAGAVIVQKLGLAAGLYDVRVIPKFTAGAPAAGDVDNFGLVVDDAAALPVAAESALNVDNEGQVFTVALVTGSLKVTARGAGTAGVTYDAEMEITSK